MDVVTPEQLKAVERRVAKVEHWSFGNGEPGADERLRNIEANQNRFETNQDAQTATLKKIDEKLDGVIRERDADTNQWLGAKKFVGIVAGVLTLIFGSGAAYFANALNQVLQALK